MLSREAHACLLDLSAATGEARACYGRAAGSLPDAELRERCRRLHRLKSEMEALLALRLARAATASPPGAHPPQSDARMARSVYAMAMSPPGAGQQLEACEAALAEACRRRATGSRDPDCRRELRWILPLQRRCRDELAPAARAALAAYSV